MNKSLLEEVIKSCRLAVLALAHMSEKDPQYQSAYEGLSQAIEKMNTSKNEVSDISRMEWAETHPMEFINKILGTAPDDSDSLPVYAKLSGNTLPSGALEFSPARWDLRKAIDEEMQKSGIEVVSREEALENELKKIAFGTETHWFGAGLPLKADWMLKEWHSRIDWRDETIEELQMALNWISVKDRMPPVKQLVLAYGMCNTHVNFTVDNSSDPWRYKNNITHWLDLPPPPKID